MYCKTPYYLTPTSKLACSEIERTIIKTPKIFPFTDYSLERLLEFFDMLSFFKVCIINDKDEAT